MPQDHRFEVRIVAGIARLDSALDGVKVGQVLKKVESYRLSEQQHDCNDFGNEVAESMIGFVAKRTYPTGPTAKELDVDCVQILLNGDFPRHLGGLVLRGATFSRVAGGSIKEERLFGSSRVSCRGNG